MNTSKILIFLVVLNAILTAAVDVPPWSIFRGTLQNNIGYAFWRGVVVSRDEDNAIYWFRKAVESKNASAANNLANLYEDRPFATVDREKLISLYRIAAEDGIAMAQNNLGVLLMKSDPEEAALWFKKAAASRDLSVSEVAAENLKTVAASGDRRDHKRKIKPILQVDEEHTTYLTAMTAWRESKLKLKGIVGTIEECHLDGLVSVLEATGSNPTAIGDLNDDGVPDAIFRAQLSVCFGNAESVFYILTVSSADGFRYIELDDPEIANVAFEKIENGRLIGISYEYLPDDPRCCPSIQKTISYDFRKKEIEIN